jgi:hypothetical protein
MKRFKERLTIGQRRARSLNGMAIKTETFVSPQTSLRKATSPWRWVWLGLCFLAAATATWALATWGLEYVLPSKLPTELLGKWVVVGGPQDGATFDFSRSGAMVGRVNIDGREGIINARCRVEANTLFSTTTNPRTGLEKQTRTQKIRSLTATSLVLEDESGQVLRLERAIP